MRGLLVVMSLAGCGRLGFDDVPPASDAVAAVQPNLCSVGPVGTLALGLAAPTKVRAAKLSTGHVLAVETASSADVHVVRLDDAAAIVSTHLPFAAGYELHGISEIGDRPFVYVFTGGTAYIKMLAADWNTYETGPSGETLPMDPQQALMPDPSIALFGVVVGGKLAMTTIDAIGTKSGDADYAPLTTFASFASALSGVRVVAEDNGTCETFLVRPDGVTKNNYTFSPCFEPRLAVLDDERGAVLHRTSATGPLAIHSLPPNVVDVGVTTMLELGSNARIATIDGAVWAAYLRTTGEARLVRLDGDTTTTRDLPSIRSPFELLPTGAFWVDATGQLSTGLPCVQ